jgi:hypothetical protein
VILANNKSQQFVADGPQIFDARNQAWIPLNIDQE